MDRTPSVRPATVAGLLLLCACRSEPPAPMLHALPEYAGLVKIEAGDAVRECRVSFHRAARRMQAQLEVDGQQVTVLRDAAGAITAFAAAVERPVTGAERERFALVEALVDPAAIEAVQTGAVGYRVRIKGRWYGVEVEPPHGGDFLHR